MPRAVTGTLHHQLICVVPSPQRRKELAALLAVMARERLPRVAALLASCGGRSPRGRRPVVGAGRGRSGVVGLGAGEVGGSRAA